MVHTLEFSNTILGDFYKLLKRTFFCIGVFFFQRNWFLQEFFSEMDEPISKISKDRDRKGFDTRRHEAFLANRISDIPEKTGWILNCRFPSLWIWYDYDFFTILLRIFWRKFFGVKFCNMTPKGQIWNMTRMGSYYIAYERKSHEDSKYIKIKNIVCNMTPISTKLVF